MDLKNEINVVNLEVYHHAVPAIPIPAISLVFNLLLHPLGIPQRLEASSDWLREEMDVHPLVLEHFHRIDLLDQMVRIR
ncbi:hypothetical protein Tco_0031443 [Tanacetum coccineum]